MKYILLLSSIFAFVGCVSMSSLQTARTLPENKSQQSIGGGVYNSEIQVGDSKVTTNLPYLEYSYRQGLSESWDAGLKLTFIGAYAADAKYQIYSDQQWAVSAGAGLGYMSYKVTVGDSEQDVKFLDFMLPLYASYDFSPSLSLYISPKIISRQVSGASSESQTVTGVTLGTKIGEKSGVYAEATLIKASSSETLTQYNLSYFW